jgi:hypothetical protein
MRLGTIIPDDICFKKMKEREIVMKTVTVILVVLLLTLWILAAGCQCQQQSSGLGELKKANISEWAQTGTGFYRPVYSP